METTMATKFVAWEVPTLETLKGSKAYILREKLNNGGQMNREEKDWLTENVNSNAKRSSKTAAQQCRYYEVDNIFVYMVETYINGNISVFRDLYHELNKDARRDFTDFLLSEVEPTYWREILKQTI